MSNRAAAPSDFQDHNDLDASLILVTVLGGAFLFAAIVFGVRAYVFAAMDDHHEARVVAPQYGPLHDTMVRDRVQLSERGLAPDRQSAYIPIEEAIRLYVRTQQAPQAAPGAKGNRASRGETQP